MSHDDETFVGDGLFVSFNGWEYKLRAPRGNGDHVIYLDPSTLSALLNYIEGRSGVGSPGADDG